MTSIEWLGYELNTKLFYNISSELWEEVNTIFDKAKEMHKQEIIDAYKVGNNDYANFNYVATSGDDYYYVTFVSKGSDNTLKDYHIVEPNEMVEISDEEIEKAAAHHEPMVTRRAWVSACKWYREQLKKKQ